LSPKRFALQCPFACALVLGWLALGAGRAPGQPALRWGGDKAGGAPYIYDVRDTTVGFEVELAAYLAGELGRKPEFVQGQWDSLPDVLKRGNIDICLNGFEYLPDREVELPSTIPYFIYSLRLIARADDDSIKTWDDLRARNGQSGKRVGVLRGSSAERLLREQFGDDIDLKPANEVDEMFQLVEAGDRLDATVQDSPAALYFVQSGRLPKLRVVGEPRGNGYYVVLTRPEDKDLRERLSEAIRKGAKSGKLEEIYRKYHLWDAEQERLAALVDQPWPPAAEAGGAPRLTLRSLAPKIVQAAWNTIALAVCSMPIAIALGILIAIGRTYGPWLLRVPLAAYVELIRGTPLLLQMFVLFFVLPGLAKASGWGPLVWVATLPPFVVGVAGLAINYSAYEAEIYRAGLMAIPKGQMEAALALGMKPAIAVRRIILPQAFRLVIPPVTNDFIALFKDTSICSMILITELTGLYYQYKWDRELALELGLVIALIYLLLSYPLSLLARRLERRQDQK
jgi:polar amino acid transport system permease protein/polar amino acid transport system substrate-binding protein